VWIPTAFVAADPNIGFPIWVPAEGDSKGFHTWNISRALKAGLTFRTVDVTVKDTLTWYRSQKKLENEQQAAVAADPKSVAATDKARTKLALDEATEAAFLKAWKANPPTKK
jgi:2'-hydroxyisoflavone reductase